MRRKDREITDRDEIRAILCRARVLHLGVNGGDRPYVVPLHYGFAWPEGALPVFYVHGLQPGPNMFTKQAPQAYTIIVGCLVANLFLYPLGKVMTRLVAKVVQVRYTYLAPAIMLFCFAGAFAGTGNFKEMAFFVIHLQDERILSFGYDYLLFRYLP